MQLQRQPPMTPRHRFILAVTVLMFLTVTGFVIGCDSDDTPTVTAPSGGSGSGGSGSGGSGSGGPTRSVESETQGRACQMLTNDEIRNTCSSTTLNVGFRCNPDGQFTHYYRVRPGGSITRRPLTCSASSASCTSPGVPQREAETGTYACYINTGIVPGVYAGTPSTPGPTPQPSSLYGSIAYGHTSTGYTWRIDFGSTESEARSKTLAFCRSRGGRDCDSYEFTRGHCAALAVGTREMPAMAVGAGLTKLEAQNAAVASCRSTTPPGRNCRIESGVNGVASVCLPSS